MKKLKKTNAARLLDRLSIAYEIKEYDVDESDLSAEHVAETAGMDIGMIYKTLVGRGDRTGVIMAVINGADELDFKALARASNNKSVELLPLKELLPTTGYMRGGCSPLGAKKNFPVFIDQKALDLEKISVSAGVRGQQLILAPSELIRAANASTADIIMHGGNSQ